jgi:hypothetical protein
MFCPVLQLEFIYKDWFTRELSKLMEGLNERDILYMFQRDVEVLHF